MSYKKQMSGHLFLAFERFYQYDIQILLAYVEKVLFVPNKFTTKCAIWQACEIAWNIFIFCQKSFPSSLLFFFFWWRGIYFAAPGCSIVIWARKQQRSDWRKPVDGFYSNDRKWLVEWFWERCMGISGKNLSGTLTSFISLDRVHKRSDRWRTPTAPKIKQQKLREAKVRESKNPTASNLSTLTSLINDKRSASQHQLRILTSWISSLFSKTQVSESLISMKQLILLKNLGM